MRYAVIDVETTGFSPVRDRIVEVACVLIDGREIAATWSSLINPRREIPPYASAVHGIFQRDVLDAPDLPSVTPALLQLCAGRTIVAHNARFDLGFLPILCEHNVICTVRLARRFFPNSPNFRNQTLRDYLGLDGNPKLRGQPAHRALGDALVTAGIFLRCLEHLDRPIARSA